MMISVVICSRNRRCLLQNALESLCRADPPKRVTWQLVIVLNDCTDDSEAVVKQFKHRLPIICESEPRPGVSYARNRAIELVSGDLVIWIDDDVRVSREWLRSYEQALWQWTDASIFGGPILPEFEGQPPLWLANTWHLCNSAFASRRVPEEGAPISLDYLPYGANFAVRASVQRQFLFDVGLGRCPADPWRGEEELEVLRAILASGGTGRWIRAALVYHVMPQERQTLAYLRDYYEAHGKLSGLTFRHLDSRFSAPMCLRELCKAAYLEARFRALRAFAQPASWVKGLECAAFARGWWIGRYWQDNHKTALKP